MTTQAEWEADGQARFGKDLTAWVFKCPVCGNEMSVARARVEFPELKGRGWRPEAECVGRYLDTPAARRPDGTRCDWCAYGLFAGPVAVTMPDGKVVHAFEFGGQPSDPPGGAS